MQGYGNGGSGASLDRDNLIAALRTACAWFEWAEPPDRVAAGQLQDVADALRDGKLDTETARLLLDGYGARALTLGGVR